MAYKMKRMYSDYKDIAKQHFFTQWFKEVKVTTHTHCSVNLLNPTYVPGNPVEQAIFDADNAFMFNVSAKTVNYPSGKTIIQKHLDNMNGQQTFIELTADATGEIMAKINKHKLEDALRKMEAHPDKWNGTGESFLDAFETKLVQLNDSREKLAEHKDVRDWLTHCLRGHPVAVAAINQQQQLEIYQKEITPNYVRSFNNFMNGLRISLQQCSDKHKPKHNPKFKPKQEEERCANNTKRSTEGVKATPEEFEKFKKELQEFGMWLEGDVFKKMTLVQKKAHHEKIKALRTRKQGSLMQANAATQAQATTPPATQRQRMRKRRRRPEHLRPQPIHQRLLSNKTRCIVWPRPFEPTRPITSRKCMEA
jgi:predicted phage tail protein